MSRFEKVKGFCFAIGLITMFLVGILMTILLVPLFVIAIPFSNHRHKKFRSDYLEFLKSKEECGFFFYTDKKKALAFIEKEILPNMYSKINPVFIQGRVIHTNLEKRHLREILNNKKSSEKFPLYIQIRNGAPIIESLNRELYRAIEVDNPNIVLSKLNNSKHHSSFR